MLRIIFYKGRKAWVIDKITSMSITDNTISVTCSDGYHKDTPFKDFDEFKVVKE